MRSIGRLLLVGVLGTLLALLLTIFAVALSETFSGAGYVFGPLAVLVFALAIQRLMRATDPADAVAEAETAAADLPAVEAELPSVLAELRGQGAQQRRPGTYLLISLIAFLALGAGFDSIEAVVLLVVILLFHELGHLAAMKIFGYRDLSVFFIPLLGAAASGRKERAPAWQQTVIALMGPAPGLLLGLVLTFFAGPDAHPLVMQALGLLIIVNALNLLPFEPFDGGRVVSLLVFSNHPRGRVVFGAVTALVLGGGALAAGFWLLGIFALLPTGAAFLRYQLAGCTERLRGRIGQQKEELPARLAEAPDEVVRALLADFRGTPRGAAMTKATPRTIASLLSGIYDAALTPSPGPAARLGLGTAYVVLVLPAALIVQLLL